ncbi:hypothetical protein JX266_007414 [Neoarthrinium moseri]|nr:hypothetical protein JX266_007414 [Neoarthrinium moseri]
MLGGHKLWVDDDRYFARGGLEVPACSVLQMDPREGSLCQLVPRAQTSTGWTHNEKIKLITAAARLGEAVLAPNTHWTWRSAPCVLMAVEDTAVHPSIWPVLGPPEPSTLIDLHGLRLPSLIHVFFPFSTSSDFNVHARLIIPESLSRATEPARRRSGFDFASLSSGPKCEPTMKEHLDSDRVNFLIWRYLIEGNYRETAVKFQKEWHKEQPHRQLDFARHVQSHALVNVLNKGLIYNSLEREYAQQIQIQPSSGGEALTEAVQVPQENAAALAEAMQLGVFGPLQARPLQHEQQQQQQQQPQPPEEKEHDPEEDAEGEVETIEDLENSRKRQLDRPQQPQLNGGSPAKRPRLSNGYENGVDAATDPMELDGQHGGSDNHAYPSPLEGEQAPTPIPRTDGPDQGTQVDKVQELTTQTIFIPLGAEESSALSSPSTASRNQGENAPVLLHCQWNPRDATILAAGGTDALARIWTISRATTADPTLDPASNHVNGTIPPFHSVVGDDINPKSNVTAMAWNADGTTLAVATDSDTKGRISLWSADGAPVGQFEVPEAPIIKLRWSPNNAAILCIAPENDGILVTVYHALTSNSISHVLPDHTDLDAAWLSESEIILCGGQVLTLLKCETNGIVESPRKFETREGDSLSQVQFDSMSTLLATCSERGFVDIWDASGKRRDIKAHDGAVTALAWQPLPQQPAAEEERLIASGGEDGAIFIWNARSTDNKPKCSMTMDEPIVALSFTPDGAFIAGATHERILIWKVGDHSIPRASWNRSPHPGWLSPRDNAETEMEEEHCLCWDATGQRLAFGVNSRLAIINFR